jgi:hypothetical protein
MEKQTDTSQNFVSALKVPYRISKFKISCEISGSHLVEDVAVLLRCDAA